MYYNFYEQVSGFVIISDYFGVSKYEVFLFLLTIFCIEFYIELIFLLIFFIFSEFLLFFLCFLVIMYKLSMEICFYFNIL